MNDKIDITALREDNQRLRGDLRNVGVIIEGLRSQLSLKIKQLETERQQREVLEVGRRNVEAELTTSHSAVNTLSVEFAGLHSRFEAAEAELSALRGGLEPVAWTDAEELRDVEKHGCGYLFKIDPANQYIDPRRQMPLFTHQRKLVVIQPYLPGDCDRTEAHYKYAQAIKAAGGIVKREE